MFVDEILTAHVKTKMGALCTEDDPVEIHRLQGETRLMADMEEAISKIRDIAQAIDRNEIRPVRTAADTRFT